MISSSASLILLISFVFARFRTLRAIRLLQSTDEEIRSLFAKRSCDRHLRLKTNWFPCPKAKDEEYRPPRSSAIRSTSSCTVLFCSQNRVQSSFLPFLTTRRVPRDFLDRCSRSTANPLKPHFPSSTSPSPKNDFSTQSARQRPYLISFQSPERLIGIVRHRNLINPIFLGGLYAIIVSFFPPPSLVPCLGSPRSHLQGSLHVPARSFVSNAPTEPCGLFLYDLDRKPPNL